jgi:uncharacterized protein YndB with AHSA1/START domain
MNQTAEQKTPDTSAAPDSGGYTASLSIAAEPRAVYAALTSADAISRWYAPCSGDANAGGQLTFHFGDAIVCADVTDAIPDRQVRWAVTVSEPLPEWEGTFIEFVLAAAEDGRTTLGFFHRGLTASCECFDMCRAGWEQYLRSLLDYVERGAGLAFGSENDTRAEHGEQTRARG